MGVVEVRKIFLVAALAHQQSIIELLQSLGQVELKAAAAPLSETPYSAAGDKMLLRLENAISFLASGQKKGLIDSLIGDVEDVSDRQFLKIISEFDPRPILEVSEDTASRQGKNHEQLAVLEARIDELRPWTALNFPLKLLNSSDKITCLPVVLARADVDKLAAALQKIDRAVFSEVARTGTEVNGLLIFLKNEKDKIEKILSELTVAVATLPETDLTPAAALAGLERELAVLENEKKNIADSISGLKKELLNLKIYYDHLYQEQVRSAAEKKIGRTAATFVLEGWAPAAALGDLRNNISTITDQFELVEVPPLKIDFPPVILANKYVVRPYEIITRMFGAPTPGEIDPTPILAFFFFIYFGICLGDAGYGLVLMFLSWWFMKRYRLPAGGLALMNVFLFGGLASVIVGMLFGSWFGIDFETAGLPLAVKNTLLKFKVLDIFKSPIVMLYFSFFLGLVQIFTGLFIGLYNAVINRDYRSAFLDHVSWICFLSSLVGWGLLKVAGHWAAGALGYSTLFWAVFLIFTQGRHKPTKIEKIWSGILSLYKTTGYLGDVLSYSRLLALGMCSAVIAMVINILAGLVKSVPVVGWILMVAVLVGGHVFNLMMSLLSAFIHSMRLQLVEFFGKFFGGGGRFFQPFQRESKYINIFKEV